MGHRDLVVPGFELNLFSSEELVNYQYNASGYLIVTSRKKIVKLLISADFSHDSTTMKCFKIKLKTISSEAVNLKKTLYFAQVGIPIQFDVFALCVTNTSLHFSSKQIDSVLVCCCCCFFLFVCLFWSIWFVCFLFLF